MFGENFGRPLVHILEFSLDHFEHFLGGFINPFGFSIAVIFDGILKDETGIVKELFSRLVQARLQIIL